MRGVARLWLAHAARDVALDGALDMEAQFLVELAIGGGAPEERSQADDGTVEHSRSY